jgi:GDP/UDP-N,N'-diacetylbacillosamine 2-epimerase (hydrolysing)
MSQLHFVTAEQYKARLIQLLGYDTNIYNVGALSLDNIRSLELLSKEDFKSKFDIDLNLPTILSTFHPETVAFEQNEKHTEEYLSALSALTAYQIVITMPNADTYGNMVRQRILDFAKSHSHIKTVESFGTLGYLTCMNYSAFVLGNSSSGFYDAAFFPKWVINIGDRQQGRIVTPNIINCAINAKEILTAVKKIELSKNIELPACIYGDGHAAEKIVQILKDKSNKTF